MQLPLTLFTSKNYSIILFLDDYILLSRINYIVLINNTI